MELTPFEGKVLEAVSECKSEVKHCCENAIRHLEKAWALKDIDKEMTVFRGITAEEEAAVAVFFCLKQHSYGNADKILFKQHPYKLGLYPFLRHIGNHLAGMLFIETSPFEKFRLKMTEVSGRKAVEIVFGIKGQGVDARPLPPLHFGLSDPDTGIRKTFDIDFRKLYVGDNYSSSLKYIRNVANQRNRLLYADSSGKPEVKGDMEMYLAEQKKKVFLFIIIVLLVDPWERAEGAFTCCYKKEYKKKISLYPIIGVNGHSWAGDTPVVFAAALDKSEKMLTISEYRVYMKNASGMSRQASRRGLLALIPSRFFLPFCFVKPNNIK